MTKSRRSFLKKVAITSSVVVAGTVAATAGTSSSYSSNGVVIGRSPKKEINYKKTQAWDDYYRSAT